MIKTSIIIPAYNEEEGIERVLKDVFDTIDETYEVIVIDDGSKDGTASIAKKFNVRLIRHEKNIGKGAALKSGFDQAAGEYVVFIDADGTYPVAAIPQIVEYLDNGYCVATGSRFMGTIEGMSLLNKSGNKLITSLLKIFYKSDTTDPLSGLRGIKKKYLDRMDLVSDGFEIETEFTIKSSKMGLRNKDIPIEYKERVGEAKLKPLKDGYIIFSTLISFMSIYNPMKIFFGPGVLLFFVGLTLLSILARGPTSVGNIPLGFNAMILGSLSMVLGYQLILFGISSKMFSVVHKFSDMDKITRWLGDRDLIKTMLLPGILLFFAGFLLGLKVFLLWINTGFGPIKEQLSITVIATTCMILGLQCVFSGLFLGMFSREIAHMKG
jgi:glycosyltransferase involved in cell wall biosynthesis